DAEALELLHGVQLIAFDKTGTLTMGKPRVSQMMAIDGDTQRLLALAAALEQGSEHPLARAVVAAAQAAGASLASAEGTTAIAGLGVAAKVAGTSLALGNAALMSRHGLTLPPVDTADSVAWLAELAPQPRLLGMLAFADTIKPASADAVRALQAAGLRTIMLSGDSQASARQVAQALGITEVHAALLPGDKVALVERLRGEGLRVAMVGDGINDAPALAAADIGVAMGGGTDVAMHTAGVTLMRGDPRLLVDAIAISRRTYAKIRQNLFWAFVFNVVGVPLAALGMLNPMLAGAAMAFSSVFVISNALLLKRSGAKGRP
ncbi:MAG: HAD-IC family P-type ATPase, partial [Massilia sp.]